jgi:hypothetical protein
MKPALRNFKPLLVAFVAYPVNQPLFFIQPPRPEADPVFA